MVKRPRFWKLLLRTQVFKLLPRTQHSCTGGQLYLLHLLLTICSLDTISTRHTTTSDNFKHTTYLTLKPFTAYTWKDTLTQGMYSHRSSRATSSHRISGIASEIQPGDSISQVKDSNNQTWRKDVEHNDNSNWSLHRSDALSQRMIM